MGDTGAILCERMILMFCGDCGCLSRPAALAWSGIVRSNDHVPNIDNRDASRPCGGGSESRFKLVGQAKRGEARRGEVSVGRYVGDDDGLGSLRGTAQDAERWRLL